MATLTNTQISVTYVGLLKTSANTVLTSTAQQITDGDGNNSIMFLSTAGVGIGGSPASGKELDVTGNVQVTGDLIVDNITIDGSTITNASGNLTIVNTADDSDIIFQSDDASGGVTTYFKLDGSAGFTVVSKKFRFEDNVNLTLGTADDLSFFHDGTDSTIKNNTGDLIIKNNADDKDIIFQSDDGSGGVETYFKLDGGDSSSNPLTLFPDNARAGFGASADLIIYHDGSNSYIQEQGTGDLIISGDNDVMIKDGSGNLLFNGNASNSAELYFGGSKKFETTSTGVTVTGVAVTDGLDLGDNEKIRLGASQDLEIYHDSSRSYIDDTGVGNLRLRGNAGVQIMKSASSEIMGEFIADGAVNLYHDNSKKFETTSTGVQVIGSTTILGTNTFLIESNSTAATFNLNSGARGFDFINNNATLLSLASDGDATFAGSVTLADSKEFILGNSGDYAQFHDGSNTYLSNGTGDLIIRNQADDKDIRFQADDGSGGNTEYFRLDGSAEVNVFSKNISLNGNHTITNDSNGHLNINSASGKQIFIDAQGQLRLDSGGAQALTLDNSQDASFTGNVSLADSKKILLGNSSDLEIYHDGSNSYIQDTGTGDIFIKASNDVFIQAANDEFMAEFSENGSVDLYHNGSKKFETSSTGVTVTGSVKIDNGSSFTSYEVFRDNTKYGEFGGGSNQLTLQAANNKNIRIVDDSGNGLIIADGGNVGIGTTSPSTKLHVDGTVRFENLPTSDPSVAGALYNDSGTLKISAG